MRDGVVAGNDGVELPFDPAKVAEVGDEEGRFDAQVLRFSPCPPNFACADVATDDAVAELGKPERLRPYPAGAVKNGAGIRDETTNECVKRYTLPLDSCFPVPAVGEVIVVCELFVEAQERGVAVLTHCQASEQGFLRRSLRA